MSRRLLLLFAIFLLLGLLAFLPLRVALGGFVGQGYSARQVAGTIWHGRVGELAFRDRRLGTFEVAANPLALLTGAMKLRFDRLDDPDGPLIGSLVGGRARGIEAVDGRVGARGLLGKLPIDSLLFDHATILFAGGRCSVAAGKVSATLAAALPGLGATTFSGTPRCEGERVRLDLADPSGQAHVEFYVTAAGEYRAWLRLKALPPEAAALAAGSGLSQTPDGWMLQTDGRL